MPEKDPRNWQGGIRSLLDSGTALVNADVAKEAGTSLLK